MVLCCYGGVSCVVCSCSSVCLEESGVSVCVGCGCVVGKHKDVNYDDRLDEVSHVVGHFLDSSVVERLNVIQRTLVVLGDEVDGHSLATETSTTANSGQTKCKQPISTPYIDTNANHQTHRWM